MLIGLEGKYYKANLPFSVPFVSAMIYTNVSIHQGLLVLPSNVETGPGFADTWFSWISTQG